MGYQQTLEANNVTVSEFKQFGSYQGTWIAVLADGRFIEGSYGSCSGCDAFEAEFGYNEELIVKQKNGKYYKGNYYWDEDDEISEKEAQKHNDEYNAKFKDFGLRYLNSSETKEEIVARYKRKCEGEYAWDDDKEILEWIENYINK